MANYPPSRTAVDAAEPLWTHPNRCEEWLITPPVEPLWTQPNRCGRTRTAENHVVTPPDEPLWTHTNRCEEWLITPPDEPLWTHTNRCENKSKLPPHRSAFAVAPLRSAIAHSLLVLLTPHASYMPSRYSPLWPYSDLLTVFLVPLRSVCLSVIAQG